MNGFVGAVLILLVVAAVAAFVGLVGAAVYFWWVGILAAFASFSVAWPIAVLLIVASFFFLRPLVSLVFMGIGVYGAIWVLGWHWLPSLLLYASTLTMVFLSAIVLAAGVAVASLGSLIHSVFRR